MNQFHYEIQNFPSKPSQEFLEKIFILNQENTPEVGSLSSIEHLRQLIQLSSYQFYVVKDDEIKGFIICFKEKSSYDSPNYKFFCNTESKFLYIDRIAIKDSFRRQGIGKSFYDIKDSKEFTFSQACIFYRQTNDVFTAKLYLVKVL